MKTLDEALKFIAEKYKNTEEYYPDLAGMTAEEKLKFAVRHCAIHSAKTTGKLSALCEDADHGDKLDIEKAKTLAVKELINSLTLADRVGLTAEELLKKISKEA